MQPAGSASRSSSLRKRLLRAVTAADREAPGPRSARSLRPVIAFCCSLLGILYLGHLFWAPLAPRPPWRTPLAVQTQNSQQGTADPYAASKVVNIVLLAPRCCDDSRYTDLAEQDCHSRAVRLCHGLAPSACFSAATATASCERLWQPRGYKISYAAAVRRAVPYLQRLGWVNLKVYRDISESDLSLKGVPEDSPLRAGACNVDALREATEAALQKADVIITESGNFKFLFPVYRTQRFIILDTSDTATLRVKLTREHGDLDDPRILAVLKPQVLVPASLNNAQIFEYTSHLAWLPGASSQPQYTGRRSPPASPRVLDRTIAALSHIYRYKYPYDCGGRMEHIRYAGFFAQNFTSWRPPPLRTRKIDLAFFGKVDSGLYAKAEKQVLAQHRKAAIEALTAMQAIHPELHILPGDKFFPDYADYVATLWDVKIFVSPYGAGEWSHKDFEAMMCGCLVMKPRAGAFTTYPAVFQPGLTVVDVDVGWANLEHNSLDMLANLDRAQQMADKAALRLLEYSDMHRYAADLDTLLTVLTGDQQRSDAPNATAAPGTRT
ncbi:hypothetical protein WJX72_005128 [[Myrmecia] bisecta]|uniref:Glycosyltransferase n=1 Tax=[Myrmecia] bisecta TaxID=41462 RepID=A0AAW1Q1F4_9CHLO